jgi:preprotein translocase subunit SecA
MEGFEMFDQMNEAIREDTIKGLMMVRLRKEEEVKRVQLANPITEGFEGTDGQKKVKKVSVVKKASADVGRNDLCPCGSGKKYKKCCGAPGANNNAQ